MATLWLIGASFILVWLAQSAGVANYFPYGGAFGLLVAMIILAFVSGGIGRYNQQTIIRQEFKQFIPRAGAHYSSDH